MEQNRRPEQSMVKFDNTESNELQWPITFAIYCGRFAMTSTYIVPFRIRSTGLLAAW